MDMMVSSILLPVAGVSVLSRLQAIHGWLLHNGVFKPDIGLDHFARPISENSLCSALSLHHLQVYYGRTTSPPTSYSSLGGSLRLL